MDRINTNYWAKPIPLRQFDWSATYDNDEPNDGGSMRTGYIRPHGTRRCVGFDRPTPQQRGLLVSGDRMTAALMETLKASVLLEALHEIEKIANESVDSGECLNRTAKRIAMIACDAAARVTHAKGESYGNG